MNDLLMKQQQDKFRQRFHNTASIRASKIENINAFTTNFNQLQTTTKRYHRPKKPEEITQENYAKYIKKKANDTLMDSFKRNY